MRVQVKLFGIFCDFLPPGAGRSALWLDLQEEAQLGDVFSRLEIPENLPREIIWNGRIGKEDQTLHEGDVIAIFSPITGG